MLKLIFPANPDFLVLIDKPIMYSILLIVNRETKQMLKSILRTVTWICIWNELSHLEMASFLLTNFLTNNSFFYWKNNFNQRTNIVNKGFIEQTILLNEQFYWKNDFILTKDFIERTILLKERFYWTNDSTEWTILLKKRFYWMIVQKDNEPNQWKMNDIF